MITKLKWFLSVSLFVVGEEGGGLITASVCIHMLFRFCILTPLSRILYYFNNSGLVDLSKQRHKNSCLSFVLIGHKIDLIVDFEF